VRIKSAPRSFNRKSRLAASAPAAKQTLHAVEDRRQQDGRHESRHTHPSRRERLVRRPATQKSEGREEVEADENIQEQRQRPAHRFARTRHLRTLVQFGVPPPHDDVVEEAEGEGSRQRIDHRPHERQPPVGLLRFRRQKGHQPEKKATISLSRAQSSLLKLPRREMDERNSTH